MNLGYVIQSIYDSSPQRLSMPLLTVRMASSSLANLASMDIQLKSSIESKWLSQLLSSMLLVAVAEDDLLVKTASGCKEDLCDAEADHTRLLRENFSVYIPPYPQQLYV